MGWKAIGDGTANMLLGFSLENQNKSLKDAKKVFVQARGTSDFHSPGLEV